LNNSDLKPEIQLRPHQQNAVKRILDKDGSLLLSHATGSGKTLTAIAAFDKLRQEGKAQSALIIAPAALRHNFGEQGIEKFTTSPYVIFGNQQENSGKDKRFVDPDAYPRLSHPVNYHIVSYDMFKKDPQKYITAAKADTLIYDEIHRGKNEASNITQVMKDVRPLHRNFIGLTGSIVSNTPGDIVPLVDAMTAGKHQLGPKAVFNQRFMIDTGSKKQLIKQDLIKRLTIPYIDHVETEDLKIAPPPKKVLSTVKVNMSPHQEDLYRFMIDQLDPATKIKIKYGIGKKLKEREMAGIFSKLMSARQLANYTKSINPTITHEQALAESPKMQRVIEDIEKHLKETPDAQIVVGSQFISAGVEPLLYHLKARGHDPAVFVGKGNIGSNETQRQRSIEDFNAGRKKILLISGAGGEGLNLPNVTKIMMLDGHYNPEVMQQMEARGIRAGGQAHRPPDKRKVEVTRYMATPTFRKLDVGLGLYKAFSPGTYIDRFMNDEPMWQNPIKRPYGPDELIGQVARRKDDINKDIKHLWTKTSAVKPIKGHLYSPKKIMGNYQAEFGSQLENDAPTDSGGWFNQEKELKHVQAYRDLMTTIGMKTLDPKRALKGSPFKEEDFVNDQLPKSRIFGKSLKQGLMGGAILTPFAGLGTMVNPEYSTKEKAIIIGAMGTALSALNTWGMYGVNNAIYHTVPVAQARRARTLTDEQIRDILRGQVVQQEVVNKVQHYI